MLEYVCHHSVRKWKYILRFESIYFFVMFESIYFLLGLVACVTIQWMRHHIREILFSPGNLSPRHSVFLGTKPTRALGLPGHSVSLGTRSPGT